MTPSLERSRAVRIVVVGTACGLCLGAAVAALASAVVDHWRRYT